MKNDKVITINISEKSIAFREELIARNIKAYMLEENFEETLKSLKNVRTQVLPAAEIKTTLEKESVNGFDVYSFSRPDYESIVLFVHGGAWVYEICQDHVTFCDELADRINAKVYAPLYPLAPKYSYKDTYKMITELYDKLVGQGKPVFVMGDSAGGNIVLGMVNVLKETGRKLPDKIAALSPCVDMTISNPEANKAETLDPLDAIFGCREFGKMWAKGDDLKGPILSPLYGDVSGYPATLLLVASNDILTPDIMDFYKKMIESGNDVTLVKGEGLWHVFPVMPVPERGIFLDILADFLHTGEI